MSHDTHFLSRLSRVSQGHVDLALSLYRDVALVKEVVAAAALPGDPPRVGFALDEGERPATVVVTREGRFVTCLAEGMGTGDLPIISRAALEGLSHRLQSLKRELEAVEALVSTDRDSLFALNDLDALSREHMRPMLAAQMLLFDHLQGQMPLLAREATEKLERVALGEGFRKRHGPLIDAAWKALWSAAHRGLLVLGGLQKNLDLEVARESYAPLMIRASSVYGFLPGAIRAAWTVAFHGKPLLPMLKKLLHDDDRFAALALAALAMRHPKHAAEVRKVLLRRRDDFPVPLALHVLDDPDDAATSAATIAGGLGVMWTAHLPAGSPARWRTPEEVPAALHLGLLCRLAETYFEPDGLVVLATSLPLLARAEAEDLYLPAEVLSRFEPQTPDLLVRLSDRLRTERLEDAPTEAAPSRNGPCPCGGGKKFKRCCGQA